MTDAIREPTAALPRSAMALALAQGVTLWWLLWSSRSGRWPGTEPRVLLPLTLVALLLPLTANLFWPFLRRRSLQLALTVGAVAVAAGAALYAAEHVAAGEWADEVIAGFVLPLILAWLLAMPLLKLRLSEGRWTGPYPALFDLTWRGALTLAEAALFTGVFWLLMGLTGVLFHLLGIEAVGAVIGDARFAFPATALVATLAIHMIGTSAGMIDGLLRQSLNLLKWLAPLAGAIVAVFALALLPELPALFADGQRTIEATWLLGLLAITVLLLNAAYQSGQEPPGYGRIVDSALRVVPPLLVVVAAVALFSLAARIQAFGVTPARYWGSVTATVALAYAIGYSVAAWSPGPWFARMGRVNVFIAFGALSLLLLSLTPFVDPLRLAVDSQSRRALTARDDGSRDGALLFLGREAGASGRRRLEEIARLPDAAGGSAALRSAAARARRPASADEQTFDDWLARIERPPAAPPITPELQSALRTARAMDEALAMRAGMLLLRVDMDGDGTTDALLLETERFSRYWLFGADPEGRWTQRSAGSLIRRGARAEALRAALRRGELRTLAPQLQDLQVDGKRVTLAPRE